LKDKLLPAATRGVGLAPVESKHGRGGRRQSQPLLQERDLGRTTSVVVDSGVRWRICTPPRWLRAHSPAVTALPGTPYRAPRTRHPSSRPKRCPPLSVAPSTVAGVPPRNGNQAVEAQISNLGIVLNVGFLLRSRLDRWLPVSGSATTPTSGAFVAMKPLIHTVN